MGACCVYVDSAVGSELIHPAGGNCYGEVPSLHPIQHAGHWKFPEP
jgi:hypothetical protein